MYTEVGLIYTNPIFNVWGASMVFSIEWICISSHSVERFPFFHILTNICNFIVFNELINFVYLSVYGVEWHMGHGVCVSENNLWELVLSYMRVPGLNSNCHTWWQTLLPSESSQVPQFWLLLVFLITTHSTGMCGMAFRSRLGHLRWQAMLGTFSCRLSPGYLHLFKRVSCSVG